MFFLVLLQSLAPAGLWLFILFSFYWCPYFLEHTYKDGKKNSNETNEKKNLNVHMVTKTTSKMAENFNKQNVSKVQFS